jgi:hypothetical protein
MRVAKDSTSVDFVANGRESGGKSLDPALYLCHRNVEFSRESTAKTPVVRVIY